MPVILVILPLLFREVFCLRFLPYRASDISSLSRRAKGISSDEVTYRARSAAADAHIDFLSICLLEKTRYISLRRFDICGKRIRYVCASANVKTAHTYLYESVFYQIIRLSRIRQPFLFSLLRPLLFRPDPQTQPCHILRVQITSCG